MPGENQADGLDQKLDKLLKLIPTDGKPKGNITLLKESGLSEDEYFLLRNKLIEQGKIGKGRGKGGSVYRLVAEETKEKKAIKVGKNSTCLLQVPRGWHDFCHETNKAAYLARSLRCPYGH